MEQKREKTIALSLAVILFVVGIICLTAFSGKKPESPIRIMFQNTAGNVLFDHKEHTEGYGLECTDCHHEYDDSEGTKPEACSECHMPDDDEESPKKSDAFHQQCKGCHEDSGSGPVNCSECHVL